MKTTVVEGNIVERKTDALITAVNSGGMWFGGIDRAIQQVAGDEFHSKLARHKDSLSDGIAVICHNNSDKILPFNHVIFVVDDLKQPLSGIIIAGLKAANRREYKVVTIPAIRTGVMKGIYEKTDQEVADQYKIALDHCNDMSVCLEIVVYNNPVFTKLLRNTLTKEKE